MPELEVNRNFTGGLRLVARKRMSTALHINRDFVPRNLTIPMTQQAGPAAVPLVEVGQTVHRGQLIGEPGESPSTAVHASLSGHVTAVERRTVPGGNQLIQADCVVIKVDPEATASTAEVRWPESRSEQLETLRNAGIVGLGGAAFPTAAKLRKNDGCHTLILNGAECEPYISCDDVLMREHAREVLAGARTMIELLDAKRCLVAVENDKPVAAEAITAAIDEIGDNRISLARVPTVYPAGGERQLVEILTGEEVPSGDYPIACGCVCQNVGTAYAINRLLRHGEPLLTRIVTVTGEGITDPQNVEVPIGTPIKELIDHCGGYTEDVTRLIHGGTMMGYAISTDELPVTKATNCVIAAHDSEVRDRYDEWPCIRCGDCAEVCPARLLPQELLRYSRSFEFEELDGLGLRDCIECGCCDVVCPSQIPLTAYFRGAKHAWAKHEQHQELADTSYIRFLSKQERLQLEQAEASSFRNELKAQVAADSLTRHETIQAAIDRAQKRRSRDDEASE
ncbi:MAG: electron transport complex subunit RsxC [Gammaproteobacteria bacterium]